MESDGTSKEKLTRKIHINASTNLCTIFYLMRFLFPEQEDSPNNER